MAALFGYGVGWAARRGAQYVRDQRNAGAWRGRRYVPIHSPLPLESWINRPEYVFGVPFGWGERTSDEAAAVAGLFGGYTLSALVANAVTDRMNSMILVTRTPGVSFEEIYAGLDELIAKVETEKNAEHMSGPYFISVGGEPAVMWDMRYPCPRKPMDGTDGWCTALWKGVVLAHKGVAYFIIFMSHDHNDAYRLWLPGFWTALGTWQWR